MAPKKKPEKKSRSDASRKPTVALLRRKIDAIDRAIVAQMDERARLARVAGQLKHEAGQRAYCPEREQQILERAIGLSKGPLSGDCVRHVFQELISGCRALEKVVRVAFLGPEYTYSHLAAIQRFGQSVEIVPVANISAVFEEVSGGQAEFGIVPIENSTDGGVADTLAMFARAPVQICGEVPLRIHHNLLGICTRSEVREVYSKPQALSQCRDWIAKHLPSAQVVELASTAEAAELARTKPGVAAVASRQAAVNYRLDVLAENIEDSPENITRFAVIGGDPAARTGDDKTSLMLELEHRPGALADTMAIFKRQKLNLTLIESFPMPGNPGRYLFFVDLLGHQRDLRVRRALGSLEKKTLRLEILGSYARMGPVG